MLAVLVLLVVIIAVAVAILVVAVTIAVLVLVVIVGTLLASLADDGVERIELLLMLSLLGCAVLGCDVIDQSTLVLLLISLAKSLVLLGGKALVLELAGAAQLFENLVKSCLKIQKLTN